MIWILDPDEKSRLLLRASLDLRYRLKEFGRVSSFLEELERLSDTEPDLILTELRIPDMSFLDFLSRPEAKLLLRKKPFMVLSSVDDMDLLRLCFQEGAVDYMTKPLKKSELIAKVERFLFPSGDLPRAELLCIDPIRMMATVGSGRGVSLTSKEFQILTLLSKKGAEVRRGDMVSQVWKQKTVSAKTINIHIFNLRRKLRMLGLTIELEPSGVYGLVRS